MTNLTLIARTLEVVNGTDPAALVEARKFAAAWFGPDCVRLEVEGESTQEYDDENSTEYGSLTVCGFEADGVGMDELYVEDAESDEEDTYFEALAAWEADPDRDEDAKPEATDDAGQSGWGNSVITERLIGERADLSPGLYYWGPAENDPYTAERRLIPALEALA